MSDIIPLLVTKAFLVAASVDPGTGLAGLAAHGKQPGSITAGNARRVFPHRVGIESTLTYGPSSCSICFSCSFQGRDGETAD